MDGKKLMDEFVFGKIFFSNIICYLEIGIGNYFDGELVRLLRIGIKSNDKLVVFMMVKMFYFFDEDVYSIIVYLCFDVLELVFFVMVWLEFEMGFVGKVLFCFVFKLFIMFEFFIL